MNADREQTWLQVLGRLLGTERLPDGVRRVSAGSRTWPTSERREPRRAVGRIAIGLQDKVYLGNLDARGDWSFSFARPRSITCGATPARRARLGWRAKTPLREGTSATYRWLPDRVAYAQQDGGLFHLCPAP